MKRKLLVLLIVFGICKTFAQTSLSGENTADSTRKMGFMIGSSTLGGEVYQQLAFRGDFPIGKLGLGLDLQLNINKDGQIRKEDWNDWKAYLDKLYYIRWGHKGDPFYIKLGGLDYTYLGYSNIVNGYSNMIEYPTVKRWGAEMSFQGEKVGGEIFLNDFKELFGTKASMVGGTRLTYKIAGDLTLGGTFAGDFNEYALLKDKDGDGYLDQFDQYPNDKNLVTSYEYWLNQGLQSSTIEDLQNRGVITDTTTRYSLVNYAKKTRSTKIVGGDIGYPLFKSDLFNFDLYAHYAKIIDYGWGAAPGMQIKLGSFLKFNAEYRRSSKEFLFGYFDNTYELNRAIITGNSVITKSQTLEGITKEMNGFFAGLDVNMFNVIKGYASYQDLKGDIHVRSLRGEIGLKENIIPNLTALKAYYIQNNVENFKEWKTPSTVVGYVIAYNMGSMSFGFDCRFTFQDKNGDGLIRGTDEVNKTISLKAGMKF